MQRQLSETGSKIAAAQEAAALAEEESESLRLDLSAERASATELGNENARLANSLNEIYVSRAWRMISRVRALMGLPSRAVDRLLPARASEPTTESVPTSLVRPGSPAPSPTPVASYPYLVSVIMPVYNKGATLRSSIDSVKAQTLDAVEIVVWDDGSTDPETLSVLDDVRQISDVAVFRAENQGVVGARNSAIAISRGRYICCLDPDDLIAPTYLEQAVALLESQPEYAITYPWVHSTGAVDEKWQTQDLEPSLITRHNHIPVCAVVRREVFEETGGFSPEMVHGYEDWELWVHAAELGFRGKAIPAHHLKYRIDHDPTVSRDARAKEMHQHLVDEIARLHPRLAKTGVPVERPIATTVRPVGPDLGPRRLPAGAGQPVVLTLPWFTVGGADRVIDALVRHWVDDGRTVVVFMTTPLSPGMSNRRHELEEITPYVYPLHDFLPARQWYEFFAATVAALASPVVLNVGSAWFYDFARAVRRDFPSIRIVDQQFNSLAHQPSNRKIAGKIDLTIAAYDRLARDLASDGRASDVEAVYVAIETPKMPSRAQIAAFRQDAGLEDGEALVLFVGRLADEKRPGWVARLADELQPDEARVVMIGDGPLREDVIDSVSSNQRLVWIPEVEAIEPAIAAADVLVLPSKIEGIPLVALEALGLGTPLVASRVGGLPDLEGEEGMTLVDVHDFDAFAEAVRKVLSGSWDEVRLPERFSLSEMFAAYDRLLFGSD
jgi:glycosyltransferase involved in cell wall biosynthesis